MIPTLPLRLRNRLAETILAALRDTAARRELAGLAVEPGARGWLTDDEGRWAHPLAERARSACAALADRPLLSETPDLGETLEAAAALFDAGLYFEVHEILEPHWMAAGGEAREALQGLIQIAVAWQHFANGNLAGARSLFLEGSGRLHGARHRDLDRETIARAAAVAADRVASGLPISPPPFPH